MQYTSQKVIQMFKFYLNIYTIAFTKSLFHHSWLWVPTPQQLTTWFKSSASPSSTNVNSCNLYILNLLQFDHDEWVLVFTIWCVLKLRMKELPVIWGVDVNMLNKQSRTDYEGCSFRYGVGSRATKTSP